MTYLLGSVMVGPEGRVYTTAAGGRLLQLCSTWCLKSAPSGPVSRHEVIEFIGVEWGVEVADQDF